jgi:hypothetical protein
MTENILKYIDVYLNWCNMKTYIEISWKTEKADIMNVQQECK